MNRIKFCDLIAITACITLSVVAVGCAGLSVFIATPQGSAIVNDVKSILTSAGSAELAQIEATGQIKPTAATLLTIKSDTAAGLITSLNTFPANTPVASVASEAVANSTNDPIGTQVAQTIVGVLPAGTTTAQAAVAISAALPATTGT